MKKFILMVIFLMGALIFCYPTLNRMIGDVKMKQEVSAFQETVYQLKEESTDTKETTSSEQGVSTKGDIDRLLEDMLKYNQVLYEEKQQSLSDPFSYEQASFNLRSYGFTDDVFGYITIPTLPVELPIYLGATSSNLKKGAVHLSQTSLPIGGVNTNSVIAAHNGWYGRDLFRYLSKLQTGDEILITNFWETLTYEVIASQSIDPTDISKILIQEGEDLLTLMTCHPYGKNTHRYLVYAKRVID